MISVVRLEDCLYIPHIRESGGVHAFLMIKPELEQGDRGEETDDDDDDHELDEGKPGVCKNLPDPFQHGFTPSFRPPWRVETQTPMAPCS